MLDSKAFLKIVRRVVSEANFIRDKEYTDEAQSFFDKLEKYVTDPSKLIRSKTSDVLSMYADKIDKKYDDLIISFIPHDKTTKMGALNGGYGFGQYNNDTWLIRCNAIYGNIDDSPRILLTEDSFIHEFIHYLDRSRRKDMGQRMFTKDITSSQTSYYNDPSEFNAYIQMTLARIIKDIYSDDHYVWLLSDKLKKYSEFKSWIIEMFDSEFISNLTDKNKKKFDKRLYNLYLEFVKRSKEL